MPRKGISCASPGPYAGAFLSDKECQSCALAGGNDCGLDLVTLRMVTDQQERTGDHISTTAMLGCLRATVLERKEDYWEDPRKMWLRSRGTALHAWRERYLPKSGWWGEKRVWAKHPTLPRYISGKPDAWDMNGFLYEVKTKHELPKWGPYRAHKEQLWINRWVIDHAAGVGEDPPIRVSDDPVTEEPNPAWEPPGPYQPWSWRGLSVIYLTMQEVKEWPLAKKSTGELDIMSDEEVEKLIVPRFEQLARGFAEYPNYLPPVPKGWEQGQGPLCPYCPMASKCIQLQNQEAQAA